MKSYSFALLFVLSGMANAVSAATFIDLRHQPEKYLQPYFSASTQQPMHLEKIRTDIDFNQIAHVRYQQIYNGYPVWDATFIVHTPAANLKNNQPLMNATVNGVIYEGLEKDLATTPTDVFSEKQKEQALQQAKLLYQQQPYFSLINDQQESIKIIIFIDEKKQAHYAYLISFYVDDGQTGPHQPTVIIDAMSLQIYRRGDQVMSLSANPIPIIAGGIGGNEKTGGIIYDGGTGHLSAIKIQFYQNLCAFQNGHLIVQDIAWDFNPARGMCSFVPGKHNNVAWLSLDENETRWKWDEINGGYSPTLDAFYAGTVAMQLYQEWYSTPLLLKKNAPSPLNLVIGAHYGRNWGNAVWAPWKENVMYLGDGDDEFYPFTSLDVVAHEAGHGFTIYHAGIDNISYRQMGALHESFADMAATATKFYVTNNNDWELGRAIVKGDHALRYLDDPKKDGHSIDNMKDYRDNLDPHYASGITNKAFYLIATSPGWTIRKAFDVMVKANMNYWSSSTETLTDAACGVIAATKDYHYNVTDVSAAFATVGLDTGGC